MLNLVSRDNCVYLEGDLVSEQLERQSVEFGAGIKKLNLDKVNRFDSVGIAWLVQTKVSYPDLEVFGLNPSILKLAKLYGVDQVL